ncbi:MAG: hypothetical protein J5706_07945, partial [Elusimicrobiales bacterium]|nr:hypothetical protein [Elusimicrobiales bacterium]
MEEKGSSGPEISMGVAEEKPKASEDIGEMKYEEYLCKLETAAKGGMLDGEYNKEKQNLDHIGKHIAKTEEIRLKTQASRQALERAYLEIKAVYGDSANKSRGKGEPGHGKSSSLTKI